MVTVFKHNLHSLYLTIKRKSHYHTRPICLDMFETSVYNTECCRTSLSQYGVHMLKTTAVS